MSRKVSQSRIDKTSGALMFQWNYLQNYLQMVNTLDIKEFLRSNPEVVNVLTMLKLDDQWSNEEFFNRLAVVMPNIMEQDDEFIISCFMAFERFPGAMAGGATKVVVTVDDSNKPSTDKPKDVEKDPVKLFKGITKHTELLEICGNDPQKVLTLFIKGKEQCGSVAKFIKAIKISGVTFYKNSNRLKAMVKVPTTIKTRTKDKPDKETKKPPVDKSSKVGKNPVKILKGHKSIPAMLVVCDNDPQKVLDLYVKGSEQYGSALKFAEALGISVSYFYTNHKKLKEIIAESTTTKPKTKETEKPVSGTGPFASLQSQATSKEVIKLLGHGKADKFRILFKALGGSEDKVKIAFKEAYTNGDRPADIISFLENKYSDGELTFKLDSPTLKKFAKVFGISKTFRRGRQSTSLSNSSSGGGIGDGGITAELATKLTDKVLDDQQVAGMASLAEEYKVDSIKDLLNKISKDGSDSVKAAEILVKHNVLPKNANYTRFMKFKTSMGC